MLFTKRIVFVCILMALCCNMAFSQKKPENTNNHKKLNPQKATIYSAILPGSGQIYNGKAWKSAIVYTGFAGIGFGYFYNRNLLKSYQSALDARFDTLSTTVDTKYQNLTDGTLVSLRNYHRRNRDICILAFAGLYILNIIDANVDAHLQEFKINKDLSFNLKPDFSFNSQNKLVSSLNLTLRF